MKIYCNVCDEYRKFKILKISYTFLKKALDLYIISYKCGHEYKIFKEE